MKKTENQIMNDFIVQLSKEKYIMYINAALDNDILILEEFDKEFEDYSKTHSEDKEN